MEPDVKEVLHQVASMRCGAMSTNIARTELLSIRARSFVDSQPLHLSCIAVVTHHPPVFNAWNLPLGVVVIFVKTEEHCLAVMDF